VPDTSHWDIRFSGSAVIAGKTLDAVLFLQNGRLCLLSLDGIPTVRVSALFDQFLGPGMNWPTEFVDLSLIDSSIFYSYVAGASLPAILPPPILARKANIPGVGLYVATTISLTLAEHAFPPLDAQINVVRDKGFTIEGDLTKPAALFDPGFLLLSGHGFEGGPRLAVRSFDQPGGTSRQFTLICAYTLFGHHFGESSLSVATDSSGPPKLAASLSYLGTLGPFTNPKLSFTWSKNQGFIIQNFPTISIPGVVLDFKKLLSAVSSKKGCGALVDLAFKEVIQASFFAKPTVSTTKPPGSGAADGQIYVLIDGYYKMSTGATLVASVNLPRLVLSFSAPGEFTFDGIVTKIGKTIVDNGEAVVEQLWNDKAQLAKCLSAFVAKEVMQKVLGNLVCDGLKSVLKDFLTALGDAVLSTIGEALGAAAAAIAGIGKACGGGGDGDSGGGGGGGGEQSRAALTTPSINQRSYQTNAVLVTWSEVKSAAGYEIGMVDSTTRLIGPVQRLGSKATHATFPVEPPALAAGTCWIRLKALASAEGHATDSAYYKAPIVKLASPLNLMMGYDPAEDVLTSQWNPVSKAAYYSIAVRNLTTDRIVATATVLQPTGSSVSVSEAFAASKFRTPSDGNFLFSVRALTGTESIPSDAAHLEKAFPTLLAPAFVGQQVNETQLQAIWTPVPSSAGYRIAVTNLETLTEALRVTIQVSQPPLSGLLQQDLSFSDFTVKTPGFYQVSVATIGNLTHLGSGATAASSAHQLFAGIGFTQVGATFTIAQ